MSNTTKAAPVCATEARAQIILEADAACAAKPPNKSAYTAEQLQLVLASIAGMAATVCDSLKASIGEDTEVDPSLLLILVSHIGSVADQVGDSFVIGSPADWCVGQSFQKAGAV